MPLQRVYNMQEKVQQRCRKMFPEVSVLGDAKRIEAVQSRLSSVSICSSPMLHSGHTCFMASQMFLCAGRTNLAHSQTKDDVKAVSPYEQHVHITLDFLRKLLRILAVLYRQENCLDP